MKPRFPDVSNLSACWYKSNTLSAQGRKYAHSYVTSFCSRKPVQSWVQFLQWSNPSQQEFPEWSNPSQRQSSWSISSSKGDPKCGLELMTLTSLATYAGTWFQSVVRILALSCQGYPRTDRASRVLSCIHSVRW